MVTNVRVIDGDSLDVTVDGARVPVRIAGIDAPEGNTPCGRSATAALEALVADGITLVDDPDPALTFDDRLRRQFHVTDRSGRSVGEGLVRAGVARATGQGHSMAALATAQNEAAAAKRGCLWGADVAAPVQQALTIDLVQQPALSALPSGFSQQVVASGLLNPTAFAFTPDGRVFIAEKAGIVRVVKTGALLATPLIDARSKVNDYWDRGLLGLAVDPNFAQNGYVYLLYAYENDRNQYSGTKTSRLSRFTVSGDVASLASEFVVLGKNVGATCASFPAGSDCIPAEGFSHSTGSIRFAADGTMFVTNGDAASFSVVDDNALRAQSLDSLAGKLIHIDRNGAGLASNPFWNGNADAVRSKVWAYGLRNPYRFNLRPGSGVPYLGDVGWDNVEEIDVAPAGVNLGWPCYEGTPRQAGYSSKALCGTLYAQGAGAVRSPLIEWTHNGQSSAVTGGAFYTGTTYPTDYQGAYFYGDYSVGFVRTARVSSTEALTAGPTAFAGTADGPVDFGMGPGGDLHYLAINSGELRRIRYAAPTPATTGFLSDQSWVSATNGWGPVERDRSNGETGAGDGRTLTIGGVTFAKGLGVHAASEVRYALAAGCTSFTAQVGLDDETGTSGSVVFQVWTDGVKSYDSGVLTGSGGPVALNVNVTGKTDLRLVVTDGADGVSSDHADWADAKLACSSTPPPVGTPPVARIATPTASTTYKVGDVVSFSGSASDAEDGTVPASGLSWQVIIHHCPGGVCHSHPFLSQSGASGSFTVPDHGDESHFELVLTATDSSGMKGTASVSLQPQTIQLTLATNPPGLQVVYGGTSYTAPRTFTAIIGSVHTITAPSPQSLSGTSYTWNSWSDGGAAQHTITAGSSNATITATFSSAPTTLAAPSALTASAGGSTKNPSISVRWADNSTNEAKFVIERSTSSSFVGVVTFSAAANATTYTDKSTAAKTTYHYRAYAVTASGQQSSPSNTATATTR